MDVSTSPNEVTIDVGGQLFRTYIETLEKYPGTTLSDRIQDHNQNSHVFFDKNPVVFAAVLEYYRTGQLHAPRDICPQVLREELRYWKIGIDKLSSCCWTSFYAVDDTEDGIKTLEKTLTADNINVKNTRWKIWRFLNTPSSSKTAMVWSYFYFFCLVLSFFVSCCMTTRAFRGELDEEDVQIIRMLKNLTNPKIDMQFTTYEYRSLRYIYYSCQLLFTLEFLFRLAVCYEKIPFCLSPLNLIDMVAIITTIISVVMRQYDNKFFEDDYLQAYIVLYSLSGVRLLRFIRLSKLFRSLKILIVTIKVSGQELFLLVLTLLVFSSIFAGLQFAAEIHNPKSFMNMFDALWWAIITMTTVGYGDEYPTSALGKVVGSLCAISGVLIMAMPVAMMAGNFTVLYTLQKNNQRHSRLCTVLGKKDKSNTVDGKHIPTKE